MKSILHLYNHSVNEEFRIFREAIQGYLIENDTIILFREQTTNLIIKNELPWDNWDAFIQDLRTIFTQE